MSGAGVPDFFYREAQRLGYVARSAFKLLQMQKQYQLINPGSSVLDLGCAPGAWLQVACQSLGPVENGGLVVGVDVKKVKVPSLCDSRVKTVCADVMNIPKAYLRSLTPKNNGFSVILSDMCPPVSGIRTKDSAISIKLGMRALDLAIGDACLAHSDDETQKPSTSDGSGPAPDPGILQPGGHLIIKLLESEEIKELSQICKPLFRKASLLRPKATRPSSREIYLICQSCNIRRRGR